MKLVCLALVATLLLSRLPPVCMYLGIPLQSRTHQSMSKHLAHASQERQLHSSSDHYKLAVGFKSSRFIANLTVGTPPQSFSVLLNSYITGLWLPSAMCPVDKYNMCKSHRRYDRNASTTYIDEGQTADLGGMLANLSMDTVSLAGLNVTNQSFAEVIEYNEAYTSAPYDGLLGLGLSQNVFYNDSSIFANMVTQTLINSAVFGLYYIKNSSDATNSGGLIIGGRNESLYLGELTYVSSTSSDTWQFVVKHVVLVNSPKMPPLCPSGCKSMLNSGSRFISTNHRTMDTLHRYLGAIVFADDYTYQFNCSNLHQLETVYVSIGGALFRIPWQSYVDVVKDSKGKTACVSTFVGLDDVAGYNWYFGEAFFASMYVEFDADNQRIGFAQSVYTGS